MLFDEGDEGVSSPGGSGTDELRMGPRGGCWLLVPSFPLLALFMSGMASFIAANSFPELEKSFQGSKNDV